MTDFKRMKIYTKTGDKGTTSLVGGKRVSKAHPRVMAYGDLDELISYLGIIRSLSPDADAPLRRIQIHLMNVSAHLACEGSSAKLKPLDPVEEQFLEERIDQMTAALPPQNAFVLPGKPAVSSVCHIARTVCRRAERSVVRIGELQEDDSAALSYLNRLSDYLFTLARTLCVESGAAEDFWLP